MDEVGANLEKEIAGLGMFVGEFTHSLDPKKRLTIPSVWRAQVGSPKSLFVLPDFHLSCLNVFSAAEMAVRLERIRRHAMSDKAAMEFASRLGQASELTSWDTQGRIRIHDRLLAFAGLTDQVLMVGALNKFQLWSPVNRPVSGEIDQAGLAEAGQYVDF